MPSVAGNLGERGQAAMLSTRPLEVGDEATDFCVNAILPAGGTQHREIVCLHDFRDKQPVILTFYGAAFTPV